MARRRSYPIAGSTVLVTGAARGIGAATARRLAERGANVALVGLEPEELERVAGECGPRATWFEADVTDVDALERAVSATLERFGRIDVAFANAGIAPFGMVRTIDPAAVERTLEVNLLGAWRTIHACLPALIDARGYLLVNASLAAAAPAPGMAPYSASKAGIEAFTRCVRMEVRPFGVRVGVCYFAFLDTDLVTAGFAHPAVVELQRNGGPLAKAAPVGDGVDAIERGIARRARSVVAPGWVRAFLMARGILDPLIELGAGRSVRDADASAAADVERRGPAASSRPVGPGGDAATRAAADPR